MGESRASLPASLTDRQTTKPTTMTDIIFFPQILVIFHLCLPAAAAAATTTLVAVAILREHNRAERIGANKSNNIYISANKDSACNREWE